MKKTLTFNVQRQPEIVPLYVALQKAKAFKLDYKLKGKRFGKFIKGVVYLSPGMYLLLNAAERDSCNDNGKEVNELLLKIEVITDVSFTYPKIDAD
jgi:hypothetical protein